MPDEAEPKFDLKEVQTVGDVTEVGNYAPLQLSGVALVTGLDGTGGGAPTGSFRSMLEAELLKKGVRNVKTLLESRDNAVVLVSALVPAGARKGDLLDIQVSLPPGSRVTSLRGGYLQECTLRNYDSTRNLSPNHQGGDTLLPGHVLGRARGPLVVGFGGEGAEGERLLVGRVWDGGVFLTDRPFYLGLKNDQKFARIANAIANRINLLFPDDARKRAGVLRNRRLLVLDDVATRLNDKFTQPTLGRGDTAKVATKDVIAVHIPYAYRFNPERYLRVAMKIPLREAPELRGRYRDHLRRMLHDPKQTIVAALRLEALGRESLPVLKEGLKSEELLVRFASAEALAYLECASGVEELARLAQSQDALRAYCLTALASLDEAVTQFKLTELMACSDVEVRYGAFRALRLSSDRDDAPEGVAGELLGDSFWLHKVAPDSAPAIHACKAGRAEVVCFGEEPRLMPPFKLLVGPEFTVTAAPGDDRCTVGRFVLDPPSMDRKQCSLRVEDVLRAMTDLGAQYTDVVELLSKAEEARRLTAPVVFDKTPLVLSVQELCDEGRESRWLTEEEAPRGGGR
ncbi:MAG: flagellar basal body P-ring protein FlgI [Gemmataceae bacterium]|nr:flagellar basal body P-ring protein FlgI [Gemmataceae bacterium]